MAERDDYDIRYYWDPVCPFAWITSRWVAKVVAQRDYRVDWRFISLRIINKNVDYDSHFPPEYEQGHTAGLRLLRLAAHIRAEHGRDAMGPLYTAMGESIFDVDPADSSRRLTGTPDHARSILSTVGLPASLAEALDDESWDAEIEAETDEARERTGKDVGTPIIHYDPPDVPALFGPVISRVPSDERAAELWDLVVGLATFPGFTELKRSLRELPALRALGVDPDKVGKVEDWHGGSRRQKHQ
jgi:2-hydroxychromene-2-carboxylate isomerase